MSLENDLIAQGIWPMCGVDEAGRGPLAGPVVAAAVILDPQSPLRSQVKDSKIISEKQREKFFEIIMNSKDIYVGISMIDAAKIDEINILRASLLAMSLAVKNLKVNPSFVLVDGNMAPPLDCRCIPVVKGDQSEPSISAASIVAKVTRDRFMKKMEEYYPGYGFSKHKGYPTKNHIDAIIKLGPCEIHRRSFRGVS